MSKINLNNYESYFIDFLEDKLDKMLLDELQLFLKAYPDKKQELEILKEDFTGNTVAAKDESITNNFRTKLKKNVNDILTVTDYNFTELYIAKKENELNLKSIERINKFISENDSAKYEAKILDLTFLKPDTSIVYKHKYKLKRGFAGIKQVHIKRISVVASIAASITLIFTILPFSNKHNNVETAHQELVNKIDVIDTSQLERERIPTKNNGNYIVRRQYANTLHKTNRSPVNSEHIIEKPNVVEEDNVGGSSSNPLEPINNIKIDSKSHSTDIVIKLPASSKKTENTNRVEDKSMLAQTASKVNNIITQPTKVASEGNGLFQAISNNINRISKNIKIDTRKDENNDILAFEINTKPFSFYTTKVKN